MNVEDKNSVDTNNSGIINVLKNVAQFENVKDFDIKIGVGSVKGDGYLGLINSAQIIGKDDTNKPKILNVVVKSMKKSEVLRDAMPMNFVIHREIYTYEKIFPTYRRFEIEKGLVPTRFSPKCYTTNSAEMNEAVVLENLKEIGYRLYDRKIPMDETHVNMVLEQYGRLHSVSLALQQQKPDEFGKRISPLDDNFKKFIKDLNFSDGVLYRYKKCIENLDPIMDKKLLTYFEGFYDKIIPFYDSVFDYVENYSVILHGDCWTNNMMFKYDDKINPSKPIRMDFLDFQIVRMGSPVLDLSYFFYACSSKDIIDNYETYLRLYYDSFSNHLRKLGSNPEKLLPYEILQKHWKKYAKFGLLIAIVVIHIMLSEKDETIDFEEVASSGESVSNAMNYEIANVDKYNERIRCLLQHFLENDFLN